MAKRYSEITSSIETHWSLFSVVRDNWGWAVTALGLSGAGGGFAWLWAQALAAPWYQKGLVSLFAFLVVAFCVTGVRAFLAWHRRSVREEGAIATGLSWSGHTYSKGSTIEGGTHRIVEIFASDQLRSDLTFRNCQILGPGVVGYFDCRIEKSEFFGLPAVQFVDPRYAGHLMPFLHHFMRCRFENCVFSGIVHVQRLPQDMSDSEVWRLVQSSFIAP
jgi:hypothetical protein